MILTVGTYTHDVFGQNPTGSPGLLRCRLDDDTGALALLDATPCRNPSFVALSPDGRLLAAAEEMKSGGGLHLFAVGEEGALTPLARQPLEGMECCFLEFSPGGNFLTGAHYGSGEAFAWAVTPTDFGARTFSHFDEGTGPVTDRQERAHVHSVRLLPALEAAVVCDLGNDTVSFYRYDREGAMVSHEIPTLSLPAGTGPRHSEFTPDGSRLYITGELSNEVLFFSLEGGAYELRQRISTLPGDFTGFNTAADLHFDGRGHLIASNRGHDSLVTYDLLPDGRLAGPRWVGTGRTPRQFTVAGKWLLCACQDSGEVQAFALGQDGPIGPVSCLAAPGAVCVACHG